MSNLSLVGCSTAVKSITMLPEENSENECVILVHGLGRTYQSMTQMQRKLIQAGYQTVNLDYPSRKFSIKQLAANYIPLAIDECSSHNPDKIHFVTHSLGGIVVRMAVKQNRPERLGRVVMLSPPNQGSEAVDQLKKYGYFSLLNGPAGQELSTSEDSTPNKLGPVDYPVGIITGDRHSHFDDWMSAMFLRANDGKVSVERAKLEGMTDFIVVHESHSFIMKSDNVQSLTVEFLKNEAFNHNVDATQEEDGPP